ncbi:MAG: ion transporter [Methanoregulaceae archaeon]
MAGNFRRRVYGILNERDAGNWKSSAFKYFMIAVIIANIIAVIIGTVPDIRTQDDLLIQYISRFAFCIFFIEYLLRAWVCPENPKYRTGPITGRLRYLASPLALIDLFVLIPFIAPPLIIQDLNRLRVSRAFQLFVLLKLIRYSDSLRIFTSVFNAKKRQLAMILFLVFFILVTSATLMYYAEHSAQPEKFSSIPATLWWSVETLTTVGYGDMVPVTYPGKMIASVVALLGIGLIALPAGILASGFYEEFSHKEKPAMEHQVRVTCPHCGEAFELGESGSCGKKPESGATAESRK